MTTFDEMRDRIRDEWDTEMHYVLNQADGLVVADGRIEPPWAGALFLRIRQMVDAARDAGRAEGECAARDKMERNREAAIARLSEPSTNAMSPELLSWTLRFLERWEPQAYCGMQHDAVVLSYLRELGPPPSPHYQPLLAAARRVVAEQDAGAFQDLAHEIKRLEGDRHG